MTIGTELFSIVGHANRRLPLRDRLDVLGNHG
jgi:hypothetical protein